MEKTFKSVDQSRKEYEMERQTLPTILRKRPIRNTVGNQPSSSAVLAAVGAGQSLLFYKTNFLSKYLETLENLTFELTHEIDQIYFDANRHHTCILGTLKVWVWFFSTGLWNY